MKAPPMTASTKEALEEALSFLDGLAENAEPGARHPLNSIIIGKGAKIYADQLRDALSSLSCGEARERDTTRRAFEKDWANRPWLTEEESDKDRAFRWWKAGVDAILATGLVPDEAAIRADEREKQIERDAKVAEKAMLSFTDLLENEKVRNSAPALETATICAKAAREIAAAIRAGRGE